MQYRQISGEFGKLERKKWTLQFRKFPQPERRCGSNWTMDDFEDTNGKKRHFSSDDETDLQKRKVFCEEIPAFDLLDFSDEILMLIL